jgi:hypothetical protein
MPVAPATTEKPRSGSLCVPASPEWRAWLERLACAARLSKAAAVDHGALLLARQVGFDEPPPPRGDRRR